MKVFKDSWNNIFDYLDAWQQLSLETREDFLTYVQSDLSIPMELMWKEGFKELQRAGFIAGNSKRLADDLRSFRRAFSFMYDNPIFDVDEPDAEAFIRDNLTNAEGQSLSVGRNYRYNPWFDLVKIVTDEGWINKFLDWKSGATWDERNSIQHYENTNWVSDPEVFDLLKDLLRRFISGKNPVTFSEMLSWQDYDREQLSKALSAGVRYLLLFPSLDQETLEPLIGIWPGVHSRLNRETPVKPVPADSQPEALEQLDVPFLVHDMTTILVNSVPHALRLRSNDGTFYKRDKEKLLDAIMPLSGAFDKIFSGEKRIKNAREWLAMIGYTDSGFDDDGRMRLFVAKIGQDWLAKSLGDKLKAVLDELRAACRQENKKRDYWEDIVELRMMPAGYDTLDWAYESSVDLPKKIIAAFTEYKPGEWLRGSDFLQWHVEVNNPLFNEPSERAFFYWKLETRSAKEQFWLEYLKDFINERLVPLGCMNTIIDRDGEFWFSLTPAGRYLLGASEEFSYDSSDGEGTILIQPNFEVVFTGPNHAAEGELSQYAERVGQGVGTLYKITRRSINAANDAGKDGDQIVQRLTALSNKAMPQNVSTQIQDWSSSYRKVSFKRIQAIICPDAETALRIQSLVPKSVEPISDTVLQLKNPKKMKQTKAKLVENGIGIETR